MDLCETDIFMIPIEATEGAITHMARGFSDAAGHNLEVFGYWIGWCADRLTHLILPEYLMGIRRDPNNAMSYTAGTQCRSTATIAVQADGGESGVMVHTGPRAGKGQPREGHWVFIPFELLVMNRPTAAYLPAEALLKHFPGCPTDKISPLDLAEAILHAKNKKQTLLLDGRHRWNQYYFLPSFTIRIDAFTSGSRIYPMNPFILKALSLNRYTRERNGRPETCYGRVHIHYAYHRSEIRGDPLIHALQKRDKRFFELMTPLDAVSMLDSAKAVQEISDGNLSMAQQIEEVLALDPKSLKPVGRSFFDLQVLDSAAARETFRGLAVDAVRSRNKSANIRWFDYIRKLSAHEPPRFSAA